MREVTERRLAGAVGGCSIALLVGGLVLTYLDRHATLPASASLWNFSYVLGQFTNMAVPAVGIVLASRRPANRIGWLFLTAGSGLSIGGFANAWGTHALLGAPGSLPAGRAAMWLSNIIWVLPFVALAFLFLLFRPDSSARDAGGRRPPPWPWASPPSRASRWLTRRSSGRRPSGHRYLASMTWSRCCSSAYS
jgi:hypothetical protein